MATPTLSGSGSAGNSITRNSSGSTNMNPTSSSSAALSRKLAKVLETRTDNSELLQALENLSTFYGKNSLANRRNLRGLIERRGIDINNQFLTVFMEVQKVYINHIFENHSYA